MKIHEIKDLSNTKIIEILKNGITENIFKNKDLIENYLYSHKNSGANLFYRLEKGEYKNGDYFVITDNNDNYLASAGWYKYNEDTCLLMTRMLVIPEYRTQYIVAPLLLPIMLEKTKDYENIWMTFNEYNKPLYDWFVRVNSGKSAALHNGWPELYKQFKPLGKKIVNGMEQYVVALEK
jgi:hypothetical protein